VLITAAAAEAFQDCGLILAAAGDGGEVDVKEAAKVRSKEAHSSV
jgi:hypothetical protein